MNYIIICIQVNRIVLIYQVIDRLFVLFITLFNQKTCPIKRPAYFILKTQKTDSQHRFLCASCPTKYSSTSQPLLSGFRQLSSISKSIRKMISEKVSMYLLLCAARRTMKKSPVFLYKAPI